LINKPWLSVVIPTIGRWTLERTLASIAAQSQSAGVEVMVVADTHGGVTYELKQARTGVEALGFHWLEHDAGQHIYGQPQRTYGAKQATAPYIWFSQDDNVAAKDSLGVIERAIDLQLRRRPLFFQCLTYWRATVWSFPVLQLGNIDADCLVLPQHLAQQIEWGLRYEGDYDAAARAFNLSGGDVAWIDQTVSISRPEREHLWWQQ